MTINCLFSGRTPKEGENIADCQDYFMADEEKGCFAIADGASQSFYPSIWAELLVKRFCENPKVNSLNWKTWLEIIQQEWFQEVDKRVTSATAQKKPTWVEGYNGISAKRPATSTFIGLEFRKDKIKVCIVGDSCLFILKDKQLESYRLKYSEDFNDRPEYFASYSKDNDFQPHFFEVPLEIESSDVTFVLATDALSEYILKYHEREKDVLSLLSSISSEKEFENFVAAARYDDVKMKNDDVTLLLLSSKKSHPLNPPTKKNDCNDDSPGVIVAPSKPVDNSDIDTSAQNLVQKLKHSRFLSFVSIRNFLNKKSNQRTTKTDTNSSATHRRSIARLKQQRAILITLLALLSPFVAEGGNKIFIEKSRRSTVQQTSSSNSASKLTMLPMKSLVFVDESPIMSTSNISEVLILERKEKGIKFQIDLYALAINASPCSNCSDTEIEMQPGEKLSVFPSMLEVSIFGQLKSKFRFKKSKFDLLPGWYKFRFVGYTK